MPWANSETRNSTSTSVRVALLLAVLCCLQIATAQNQLGPQGSVSESQQYEKAAAYYENLLAGRSAATMPRAAQIEARTRLATAYFMLHRFGDSLRALEPLTTSSHRGGKTSVDIALPAQAWIVRGLNYLELNQPARAIPSLRWALVTNPNSGTARLALGDALARTGRLEDARREYEKQTRLTPQVPDAWYKLGLVRSQLASELSRTLSEKSPDSALGQQLAAEEMLAKGNNLQAARTLSRLVHQAPGHLQIHADLGRALLEIGNLKQAESEFQQEISLDPECPLGRFGLAAIATLRGNWDDAVSALEGLMRTHARELERLLEYPPPGVLRQAWTERKLAIPERLNASQAAMVWKKWLDDYTSAAPFVKTTAKSNEKCGELETQKLAVAGFWVPEPCYRSIAERLRPKKSQTKQEQTKLAEAEFRLGNYEAARGTASKLLDSSPRSEWGAYWLSKSYAALAEESFVKVGALNPNSARVHQMLAQHYASWSDYSRAKAEYLAAIRLAPELPDLHFGLGTVYWRTGEWPNAEEELRKTLELSPGAAQARYELGNAYLQQRRWQEALNELRQVPEDSSAQKLRATA